MGIGWVSDSGSGLNLGLILNSILIFNDYFEIIGASLFSFLIGAIVFRFTASSVICLLLALGTVASLMLGNLLGAFYVLRRKIEIRYQRKLESNSKMPRSA